MIPWKKLFGAIFVVSCVTGQLCAEPSMSRDVFESKMKAYKSKKLFSSWVCETKNIRTTSRPVPMQMNAFLGVESICENISSHATVSLEFDFVGQDFRKEWLPISGFLSAFFFKMDCLKDDPRGDFIGYSSTELAVNPVFPIDHFIGSGGYCHFSRAVESLGVSAKVFAFGNLTIQ